MRSERPYIHQRDQRGALAEIRRGAGTQFDPHLVKVFCHIVKRGEHDDDRPAHRAAIAAPG